jgi:AcrR family transcriptional regulator
MKSSQGDTAQVRPGRPRSESARKQILDAAGRLLEERGLHGMSIEQVAEDAGVGKATIYRWWPSKAVLAFDAFLSRVESSFPLPDDGSLTSELRGRMRALVRTYGASGLGRALSGFIAEAQTDPELADLLRAHVIAPLRSDNRELFARGLARGEISDLTGTDALLDMLSGAIIFRLLFRMGPLNQEFADEIVDTVLESLSLGSRPRHT